MIQRTGDVPSAPLEDSLLMMSVELGRYFSLNSVAKRIWEMLEYPTQPAAIVRQLVEEYDVSVETCATQVGDFLKKLRERGLLADVDGDG
jgi:hypothetical protein